MKKEHIQLFLTLLSTLAACVLVMGNFIIARHITLPLIGLAVMAGCAVVSYILNKKIEVSFDWKILLCLWAIYGAYYAACMYNQEVAETTNFFMTFKSVILGYSAVVFITNWKDLKCYYAVFLTFILTNSVLAFITVYNYVDLIYIHHAEGLHPSWVNFIDMLYDKIIPYHIYHHLLSIFTVFSIYLCFVCLSLKVYLLGRFERILLIFLLIFLIAFIHFLSARIGLLIFYFWVIIYIIQMVRKYKVQLSYITPILLMLLLIFSLIYTFIPTIHVKAQLTFNELSYYVQSDYEQIKNGPDYRLKSYFIAIEDIKNAPLHGIGYENIVEKLKGKAHPHNIYLFYGVFFGLPLAVAIALFTYLPLFFAKRPLEVSILVLYAMHTLYSFTDVSLEIKTYFYFFSFWLPFMMCYQNFRGRNLIE